MWRWEGGCGFELLSQLSFFILHTATSVSLSATWWMSASFSSCLQERPIRKAINTFTFAFTLSDNTLYKLVHSSSFVGVWDFCIGYEWTSITFRALPDKFTQCWLNLRNTEVNLSVFRSILVFKSGVCGDIPVLAHQWCISRQPAMIGLPELKGSECSDRVGYSN